MSVKSNRLVLFFLSFFLVSQNIGCDFFERASKNTKTNNYISSKTITKDISLDFTQKSPVEVAKEAAKEIDKTYKLKDYSSDNILGAYASTVDDPRKIKEFCFNLKAELNMDNLEWQAFVKKSRFALTQIQKQKKYDTYCYTIQPEDFENIKKIEEEQFSNYIFYKELNKENPNWYDDFIERSGNFISNLLKARHDGFGSYYVAILSDLLKNGYNKFSENQINLVSINYPTLVRHFPREKKEDIYKKYINDENQLFYSSNDIDLVLRDVIQVLPYEFSDEIRTKILVDYPAEYNQFPDDIKNNTYIAIATNKNLIEIVVDSSLKSPIQENRKFVKKIYEKIDEDYLFNEILLNLDFNKAVNFILAIAFKYKTKEENILGRYASKVSKADFIRLCVLVDKSPFDIVKYKWVKMINQSNFIKNSFFDEHGNAKDAKLAEIIFNFNKIKPTWKVFY